MKLRIAVTSLAVLIGVVAVNAGSALAHPGDGKRGDRAGHRIGGHVLGAAGKGFTCERGEARLAKVETRITKISDRIEAGEARNAQRAARKLDRLENRATRLKDRIAEECEVS